jgi:dinuclear metal center YbgI/SA1388 family protein
MTGMQLAELDVWFRDRMRISDLAGIDGSLNGIQVTRREPEIGCVAFAVDACMETFRRAVEQGADMLLVHHGIFWGHERTLTGTHFDRIRFLLENDLALYAVHLPLDMHPQFGNNAGMASVLGLTGVRPFGSYKGQQIGCAGVLPEPRTIEQICSTLFGGAAQTLGVLPFGPREIRTVGLVSGGAPHEVEEAIADGLDLYITGDASHTVYHRAMEEKINVVFGGHYLTETWGVQLLSKLLAEQTGIRTFFIDVPTGL